MGEFTSELGSITTFFDVEKDSVHTVTLESIGLHSDQWISILEVSGGTSLPGAVQSMLRRTSSVPGRFAHLKYSRKKSDKRSRRQSLPSIAHSRSIPRVDSNNRDASFRAPLLPTHFFTGPTVGRQTLSGQQREYRLGAFVCVP